MIKVEAPGKLMFSGEWSVLEHGNPAIVFALDKKVQASIEPAEHIVLNAPAVGIYNVAAKFDGKTLAATGLNKKQEEEIVYLQKSTEVALRYLKELKVKTKTFKVTTESKETKAGGKKIGFGSSAAVCVAVVFGVCEFHGIKLKPLQVFKLATIAHYIGQGKVGSGFDVCASAFGGAIIYTRFSPEFVEKAAEKGRLKKAVERDWPGLRIKKIKLPNELKFLVVFSGKNASTRELVGKMNAFKALEKKEYSKIIAEIARTTKKLANAFLKNDKTEILALVKSNRLLLKKLGEKSGTGLETTELKEIIETALAHGCAAKFSGAGGGDSAIVVGFEQSKLDAAAKALKEKGFILIDSKLSFDGVKEYASG